MGYDSFGLPAEQFAIQTGKHPSLTTQTNIKRYRQQLNRLGFLVLIGIGKSKHQIHNFINGLKSFLL